MKLIARLAALAGFLVPAIIAWFVCPWLIAHGSSSAFEMAAGLAIISLFSAVFGVVNFLTTAA